MEEVSERMDGVAKVGRRLQDSIGPKPVSAFECLELLKSGAIEPAVKQMLVMPIHMVLQVIMYGSMEQSVRRVRPELVNRLVERLTKERIPEAFKGIGTEFINGLRAEGS
jgi:hypothetical protein